MEERINSLKQRAYYNGQHTDFKTRRLLFIKGLYEYRKTPIHNIKRAQIDSYIMENYPIEIDSEEWLVGRFAIEHEFTPEEQQEYDRWNAYRESTPDLHGADGNGTGHRVIDFEKLLTVGVCGYLEEISRRESGIDFSDPGAAERVNFYKASRIELEGFLRFADRYAETLKELAEKEKCAERKKEYKRMAENFFHVPRYPARNFYEAIQCVWFTEYTACLLMDTVLTGRPDQYLYPYYQKDISAGTLTPEFAMKLIENLYLKHNEIYDAWPASIMVGGVDRQGNPAWNELSRMFIDAIETTGLVNPSVAVCYNEEMPDELLLRCVDIISKGYTRPSFFNDRVVTAGLLDAGVSLEDARYYIHSTCVEITPIAASNIMVATPYINLCKALEYLLGGGVAIYGEECRLYEPVTFTLEDLSTFQGFKEKTKEVIRQILKRYLADVCDFAYYKAQYTSTPFVSVFTNDCLARGIDSSAGGARYNFVYPCFPGFLTLVDSLAALRQAVYEEGKLTLSEFGELLKNNFEDGERLREYLLHCCPKFGNDDDRADSLAVEFYDFIRHELEHYRICIGGSFHPSYFAWVMHGKLGKVAAATPDGRQQGMALSECLGTVQGMDKKGPFAVVRSVSKLDQKYGIGGIATNFRFSRSLLKSDAGKAALASFIRVFMEKDCFEIQFNVVDQKTLLEAQAHPEQYKTLLVRVAGYSDYFVNLDPIIQNEIIQRSEHGEF